MKTQNLSLTPRPLAPRPGRLASLVLPLGLPQAPDSVQLSRPRFGQDEAERLADIRAKAQVVETESRQAAEALLALPEAIASYRTQQYGEATGLQILTSLRNLLLAKERDAQAHWPRVRDQLVHYAQQQGSPEGARIGRPSIPEDYLRFTADELAFQFRKDFPKPKLNACGVHPFKQIPYRFEKDPFYAAQLKTDREGSITFPTGATEGLQRIGLIAQTFYAYELDAPSSVYHVSPAVFMFLKSTKL
jgi:hypothetical protein